MPKSNLPSLERLIRQRIQRRIILAMIILVGAASILTAAEAAMSVSKRLDKLRQRAIGLQDLVTSEILVHNAEAVEAILSDANVEYPDETVHWLPPESSLAIDSESLQWHLSGRWTLATPLREWGDQKFGAFIFSGHLLKEDALISLLTYRVIYVLFFCAILCAVLLPVARRTPNDLILNPVRQLLSLVGARRDELVAIEAPAFSELKDLESELRSLLVERRLREDEQIEIEQNKAITQAAQMLAHDIRRPFALLKAALDGMAIASSPEAAKRLADRTIPRLTHAFSTLDAMLDELIMLGRPHTTSVQSVDLGLVAKQAAEATVALHPGSESRITYDMAPGLFVLGHVARLHRVIANLVTNALQAMSATDTLRLVGRSNGTTITIRVENTGSYIPAEDLTSIFKLFYTKGKLSGSGIGLAICKRIVTDHHGKITASSSLENGTAFVISLPAASVRNGSLCVAVHDKAANPSIPGKKRLLIVDDEAVFRHALADTASTLIDTNSPIDVTTVATGEEAVCLAVANPFDAIVIDVDLGKDRMDGIEAVRLMRGKGITAMICVHTNNATQSSLDEAIEAGADAFVPKPMTQDALKSVLGC